MLRLAATLAILLLAGCATMQPPTGGLEPHACYDTKPNVLLACGPVAMVRP